MSNGEIRKVIEAEVTAFGSILYAGTSTSLASALMRSRGLKHEKYPHLMPLTMRAEMREFLESAVMPNGWGVEGDSRKMGQLLLANPDLNLEMQFLKERRRTCPSGVPVAGRNEARRDRWSNDPLDFALAEPIRRNLDDPTRLLLLWDFLNPHTLDQFTLRVVHTLEPGVYGKAVPCDLILDVQDGGTIFSHLKFDGATEDDDFFIVEIADEDDESGS